MFLFLWFWICYLLFNILVINPIAMLFFNTFFLSLSLLDSCLLLTGTPRYTKLVTLKPFLLCHFHFICLLKVKIGELIYKNQGYWKLWKIVNKQGVSIFLNKFLFFCLSFCILIRNTFELLKIKLLETFIIISFRIVVKFSRNSSFCATSTQPWNVKKHITMLFI